MSSKRNIYHVIDVVLKVIDKATEDTETSNPVLDEFVRKLKGLQKRSVYYAPEAGMFLWKELSEACYWYFCFMYPEGIGAVDGLLNIDKALSWEHDIYDYIVIPEMLVP